MQNWSSSKFAFPSSIENPFSIEVRSSQMLKTIMVQEKQTLRVPVYAGFKLARTKTLHFELAPLHTASYDIAELQSTNLKFLPIQKTISAKAALENRQ